MATVPLIGGVTMAGRRGWRYPLVGGEFSRPILWGLLLGMIGLLAMIVGLARLDFVVLGAGLAVGALGAYLLHRGFGKGFPAYRFWRNR